MKGKVENGQLNFHQDATMAMAATEIVIGETEDYRKGDGFRRTFLEILMNRKEEIEKSINNLTNGKKEYTGLFSADEIIEELDRAALEIAAQTHYSLLERKSKELKKIKILIHRARHEEEFGLCEECERRIPAGRLLIVPEATLCVPCQREMEKWESGRSSMER
jgi:DnaK suppressor protein